MRWVVLAISCLSLVGCESDWFGDPPPPPLEGERIAILELGSGLASDPEYAAIPIELPPQRLNPEWPQYGGSLDKAMHHLAHGGSWQRVWSRDIGDGQSDSRRLVGTPVIAAGMVFTIDSDTRVSALDEATGTPVWSTDITAAEEDDGWGGGLAFDDGRLFVTTGNGEILALDPADGVPLWRVDAGPPIRTPPAASQGRVHVVTADNTLLTLDAATGDSLWVHRGLLGTASLMGGGAPSIAGSFVVATYTTGEVVALRAENGRVVWGDILAQGGQAGVLAALDDINGSAVIDRDLVFVASYGGRLAAIDVTRGIRVWEQNLSITQTPWVAGDYLWVVTSDAELICFLKEDGRVRWITRLPVYEDPEDREGVILWSGPVLAGERLIVAGSHGDAVILSPYTGDVIDTVSVDRGLPLPPVVANARLYFVGDSGTLTVLD